MSFSHLLNDTIQSLLPAIYPLLKENYHLTLGQIGLITLSFQATASLLQPLVGFYTDRQPKPYSLAVGMGLTLIGLIMLSRASDYRLILVAAAMVGMGSSIFHPEASRIAHMAAGGRHGFAQSLFQVGGNLGSSLGPLAGLIIVAHGQASIIWFSAVAALGIFVLYRVGGWYQRNLARHLARTKARRLAAANRIPRRKVVFSITILLVLIFSKYVYLVSLFSVAAGTFFGGPLGDRFGRKYVIWFSILGVAPFSLVLPHVGLGPTIVLSVFIGGILSSAFSAILVYAQELVPGKVGLIAGLFFGFAFGISGIAAAALGRLADHTSIEHVFFICGFLPLIGVLTALLPNLTQTQPVPAAN
jgi:FSR family fosmidomycin resistance protein-like MFS transporter